MGSYRHDLLVAMRLINTVEKELVQTEYENWVFEESVKCREVGRLLAADERRNQIQIQSDGAQKVLKVEEKLGEVGRSKQRVREWYDGYCESCYDEQVAIAARLKRIPGRGGVDDT